MSAMSLLGLALDAAAVAALWLIAARLTALPLAPPSHATTSTTEPPERNRTMSLSDNERRRHGLSLVRRTIASGKYTKKDVTRWEDEFGAEAVQALMPDSKPKGSSSSKSDSKE